MHKLAPFRLGISAGLSFGVGVMVMNAIGGLQDAASVAAVLGAIFATGLLFDLLIGRHMKERE